MTLALATLGALPALGAEWDAVARPEPQPLEATVALDPDDANVPAFMRNYEMRWALPADGDVPGWGGWLRTARAARARRAARGGDDRRLGAGGVRRARPLRPRAHA